MGRFLLSVLWLLAGWGLAGQATSVVVLAVETEPATEEYRAAQLRDELQALTDDGEAEAYGSLGVRLKLKEASKQQISGMAKRSIVRYDYTLSFTDYVLDLPVEEVMSGVIAGSGGNAVEARTDALRKLVKKHLGADDLVGVRAAHRAALPDCGQLVSRLQELDAEGKGTGVLAVSAQLDPSSDCGKQVEALVDDIYQRQQAADCRRLIMQAKAAVVAGHPARAGRLLAGVDPTLACAEEAEALLDELMDKDLVATRLDWYAAARRSPTLPAAVRRRIISNLVLSYAYQNY